MTNSRKYLNERDRSYKVRETVPTGSRVRLGAFTCYAPRRAGRTGVVESYDNAGFRGIEAWVRLDQPIRLDKPNWQGKRALTHVTVSAGIIEAI